ncbi:MAG: TetR/AcrR family transcriptional regulator [Sciscionella sp.]
MSRAQELSAAARGRRERERTDRRESILAAARETFAARGFAGSTMEEVALRAEITKPTLYGYFRTKDELLLLLMVPVFADIATQLEQLLSSLHNEEVSGGEQLIASLLDAVLFPYRADPGRFRLTQLLHQTRLVESLDSQTHTTLDTLGRKAFKLARSILREAMQRGLIRDVAVAPLADVIWGIVVGTIQVEDIKNRTGGRAQLPAALQLATDLLASALIPID